MPSSLVSDRYRLRCTACGAFLPDEDYRLKCTFQHKPAFLRTAYLAEHFAMSGGANMARYERWLPAGRAVAGAGRAGVYKAEKLAAKLEMSDLWIAFGGWLPMRNATLPTATFTDLQATAAFARIPADDTRPLVVAAMGASAASFAAIATALSYPLVLVVNAAGLRRLGWAGRIGSTVRTILVADGAPEDVVRFANELGDTEQFIREGGVANVARRDGVGTMMLEAVELIGKLPDVYVQAVNEGTGALGMFETSLRLIADGRYGSTVPKLVLGQNAPSSPVADAWQKLSPMIRVPSPDLRAQRVEAIYASMLASQTPPYDVRGGIFDALVASGGATYSVKNEEIIAAARLFWECEQVDIEPEAAVAVASLQAALAAKTIDRSQTVLLGITAGGSSLLNREKKVIRPTLAVTRSAAAHAVTEQLLV
jgi:cysteate synthase